MRVMLALSVLESLATLASAATPTTSGTPLPIPKDLRCATSFPDRETLKTPCIDPLQARLHTPTIHFDVGRARIRPTSYATLDALASLLTRVPIGLTEVQRHKASDGRQAYGRRPT
ncbi:MAG: outer membrane protein OmpA-like peptidoglycan-associated protein, partial [Myxococcota bacterium]